MGLQVRRVVAANDANGRCTLVSDDVIPAVSRGMGAGINGSEMWSTDQMPVDNAKAVDHLQRAGFVKRYNDYNWVGTGGGSTFRVTEWAPGHAKFTHRTQTVDYDIVLSGEIDLILDGGEVVHLKAGDVVILRGGTHLAQHWDDSGNYRFHSSRCSPSQRRWPLFGTPLSCRPRLYFLERVANGLYHSSKQNIFQEVSCPLQKRHERLMLFHKQL